MAILIFIQNWCYTYIMWCNSAIIIIQLQEPQRAKRAHPYVKPFDPYIFILLYALLSVGANTAPTQHTSNTSIVLCCLYIGFTPI